MFFYTAPATGRHRIDTTGSDFDTALAVYSGCAGDSELFCSDDIDGAGGIRTSGFILEIAAGQSVIIAVSGFAGLTGAYQLNINLL
jgi:hypothetical protein